MPRSKQLQPRIILGEGREGIKIFYHKKSKKLTINGWYDSNVSIEGTVMTLKEFLTELKISVEDCVMALEIED